MYFPFSASFSPHKNIKNKKRQLFLPFSCKPMTKPCLSILQAIHSCEENPSPLGNHRKSKETN